MRWMGEFDMKESSLIYRVLVKLGLKQPINYNSVDFLRSRGVQICENVNLINTTIDWRRRLVYTR